MSECSAALQHKSAESRRQAQYQKEDQAFRGGAGAFRVHGTVCGQGAKHSAHGSVESHKRSLCTNTEDAGVKNGNLRKLRLLRMRFKGC